MQGGGTELMTADSDVAEDQQDGQPWLIDQTCLSSFSASELSVSAHAPTASASREGGDSEMQATSAWPFRAAAPLTAPRNWKRDLPRPVGGHLEAEAAAKAVAAAAAAAVAAAVGGLAPGAVQPAARAPPPLPAPASTTASSTSAAAAHARRRER